jgi:hypothetical protein
MNMNAEQALKKILCKAMCDVNAPVLQVSVPRDVDEDVVLRLDLMASIHEQRRRA